MYIYFKKKIICNNPALVKKNKNTHIHYNYITNTFIIIYFKNLFSPVLRKTMLLAAMYKYINKKR